jgi:hypothetical protein
MNDLKLLTIIISFLLFFNIYPTYRTKGLDDNQLIEETISFSPPQIYYNGNLLNLIVDEANDQYIQPYQPILPVFTKRYIFPIGTKIKNISFKPDIIDYIKIRNEVNKNNYPNLELEKNNFIINIFNRLLQKKIDKISYNEWFYYRVGSGILNNERHIFLTIGIFPVKYDFTNKMIKYFEKGYLYIDYEESKSDIITNSNEADMLIVTTNDFLNNLSDYIEHKSNSINIIISIIDDIPKVGRDLQEDIKFFIKENIEKYGITQVLLIGDNFDIPSREVYVQDIRSLFMGEKSFTSDLYYADIYNSDMAFSSWDTNNNDIFGEFRLLSNKPSDILDLYPDVYIGRLCCRNKDELLTSLDKIISYETNLSYYQNWFSNIILIGGDTFTEDLSSISEGEFITDSIIDTMDGFNFEKIWGSNNRLRNAINISNEIEKGAGFVCFEGHAGLNSYRTHPEKTRNEWIPIEWYRTYHINNLRNKDRLPILTINGCNTCKFSGNHTCLGWSFITNPKGGGIASIGMTSLSWIYPGIFSNKGLGGLIHISCYKSYISNNVKTFGELWANSITEYLNSQPWDISRYDYRTIESWQPLGDPSLIISK